MLNILRDNSSKDKVNSITSNKSAPIVNFQEPDTEHIFSNINSEKITETIQQPIYQNQYNQDIQQNIVLIKYDQRDNKFRFKDTSNRLLGCFSVEDVILYISSHFDPKGELSFSGQNIEKIELIKKYICTIKFNNKINHAKLFLHDDTESNFMRDIEMLILFNRDLDVYSNKFYTLLNKVNPIYRDDIREIVDKFMISMIHYSINFISGYKNKTPKLVEYTSNLTYRLMLIIENKINHLELKQDALYDIVNKSILLKKNLEKKVSSLYSGECSVVDSMFN